MRELGRVLRSYAWEDHEDWDQIIPRLETVINHVAHSSTGYPPVALEFDYRWYSPGKGIRMNAEEKFKLPPKLLPLHQQPFRRREAPDPETPQSREQARIESREGLGKSAAKRKRQADKKGVAQSFEIGDLVWRKTQKRSDALHRKIKKLYPVYEGPFRVIATPHPNSHELSWLDGRYAGIANLRQLRPHRESTLRPEERVSTSVSETSLDSDKEPFIAVIEQHDQSCCLYQDGHRCHLPKEHRPWSQLKRTQTHLNIDDYIDATVEGRQSRETDVELQDSTNYLDPLREEEKPTLFDLRIVEDIAWFLETWRRALVRHKRRKENERSREGYHSDSSLSTLSSGSYSTRLKSEIDQAIQGYDRALAFHKRHSPFPNNTNSLKIDSGRRRINYSNVSDNPANMDAIGRKQLKQINSMTQLREIREYWLNRKQESIQRQEAAKEQLIQEILKLRQETWDEEKRERSVPSDPANKENEITNRDLPFEQKTFVSSRPEETSISRTPPLLEAIGTRNTPTPSGLSEEISLRCPLLELQRQMEIEELSETHPHRDEKRESRTELNKNESPKPGTSRSTQSRMSLLNWTSDSSDEEPPLPQSKTDEKTPSFLRRQRFNDPQNAMSRLRNPHTGRFISKNYRELIGPPGRKPRPEYLPRRPSAPTILNEEKDVVGKINPPTVFERLGPKILSQQILTGNDKIIVHYDKEQQLDDNNRPNSA